MEVDQISPKLVVNRLVLPDSNPGHLLQHSLPTKALEAVDFQFRIPDVLQALGGDVDFLGARGTKSVKPVGRKIWSLRSTLLLDELVS